MARLAEIATYRPHCADDMPLINDSWLNDWRVSRYAGIIPNNLYYDVTRTVIEELIARGARIVVAEHRGEILGWACGEVKDEKKVLHYLYCKDPFIGKGVEERLISELPGAAPGWFTFALERFIEDRNWTHAPEMARRQRL